MHTLILLVDKYIGNFQLFTLYTQKNKYETLSGLGTMPIDKHMYTVSPVIIKHHLVPVI